MYIESLGRLKLVPKATDWEVVMRKITRATTWTSFDGVEYEATATIEIEDDGTFSITKYDYFDFHSDEWKSTEERDFWSTEEIIELFPEADER